MPGLAGWFRPLRPLSWPGRPTRRSGAAARVSLALPSYCLSHRPAGCAGPSELAGFRFLACTAAARVVLSPPEPGAGRHHGRARLAASLSVFWQTLGRLPDGFRVDGDGERVAVRGGVAEAGRATDIRVSDAVVEGLFHYRLERQFGCARLPRQAEHFRPDVGVGEGLARPLDTPIEYNEKFQKCAAE